MIGGEEMKTLKDLSRKQREQLDEIPAFARCESVGELLFWESEGFGDCTISELASILMDYIKEKRKEATS